MPVIKCRRQILEEAVSPQLHRGLAYVETGLYLPVDVGGTRIDTYQPHLPIDRVCQQFTLLLRQDAAHPQDILGIDFG